MLHPAGSLGGVWQGVTEAASAPERAIARRRR